MVETGSYNVNKSSKKDSSFKSFICALLVILALLLLIFGLLYGLKHGDKSREENNKAGFESLTGLQKSDSTNKQNKTTSTKSTNVFNTEKSIISTKQTSSAGTSTVTNKIEDTTKPNEVNTSEKITELFIRNNTESSSISNSPTPNSINRPQQHQDTTIPNEVNTSEKTTESSTNAYTENSSISYSATPNSNIGPKYGSTFETTTTDDTATSTSVTTNGNVKVVSSAPSVCRSGVCKRAASSMLATMNHEDGINRCDDYYNYICGGQDQDDEKEFFHYSFKKFINKIQNSPQTEKHLQLFGNFYNHCTEFGNSITRLDRLQYLNKTEKGLSLNELMKNLILTQTMPFFDIGLNLNETKFILEIILPGTSYLKTNLKGWSLMDQINDYCIIDNAAIISQNKINLDKVSPDTKNCITEKIKVYITDFKEEIEKINQLTKFNLSFNSVTQTDDLTDDLIDILKTVQESLDKYHASKFSQSKITLDSLNKNFGFGLDWISLFQDIVKTNVNIDENTVVYITEHIKIIFEKLILKKDKLQPLLELWYNIELYKNIVIEKPIENRRSYCLDIAAQLLPEVAANVIVKLNTDKNNLYNYIQTSNMLRIFKSSVEKFINQKSSNIIDTKKEEIKIISPQEVQILQTEYEKIFEQKDSYPEKLFKILENFKKTIFSLHETSVEGEKMLKYFVNAFETKPKSFPPSRFIVFQPGLLHGISETLPSYVKIAKIELPFFEQISRHFTRNNLKGTSVYEDMEKAFNANYLTKNVNYTIEREHFEVMTTLDKDLNYDDVFADNMAFRLATDAYKEDTNFQNITFLNDFSRNETFIIMALQGYCRKNTLDDFIRDYYNLDLPAPVMLRNIAKNSKFYAEQYNCGDQFERKQFPDI